MADITNVLKILSEVSEMLYQMYQDETDKESISVRYDQYLAVDDAIGLLKEQKELKDYITKYADKTVVFPRFFGRTASQLESMMELIKSGEPVVYISPDYTTEIKPVTCCKDCKYYDSGLCWNVPKNESPRPKEVTFFCADGKRKSGEQE